MTFVQTSFLLATAAVAIPIVVHLLSRRQVRRVELGTMRFLQDVLQDGSQQRQLRRWLLLAVRASVMLLLALLFARPYVVDQLSGRSGSRSRIILIDRSASMGMAGSNGRLVDDAVVAAIDSATELGEAATIVYAWFDRHVQPMSEDTQQPVAPRTVAGSTDYGAAIRWAKTAIDAKPDRVVDVVLITDLQQNGLQSRLTDMAISAFPADVPVQILDVGREAVNNLAISHVSSQAARVAPGYPVKIDVTLFNYGSLPYEEVSTKAVAFDGQKSVRISKSVNVGAGEAQELRFDLGKLSSGTWQITVSIDVNDDLVTDNQRLTAVEVAAPARVIVFDFESSDSDVTSSSYYVRTALAQDGSNVKGAVQPAESVSGAAVLSPAVQSQASRDQTVSGAVSREARFAPEVVDLTSASIPSLSPKDVPLVVICDTSTVDPSLLQRLNDYVQQGGRLLVFAGDMTASRTEEWQQSPLSPGQLKQAIRSGTMPFRIVSLEPKSRMMQPFSDPQHADLSRLVFRRLLPVTPDADTQVVAWFDEGRPAITQQVVGQGRVIWFLSGVDSQWSNWTSSPLYLPVVQQMAAELLNLTGEGRIRHRDVGDDDHRVLVTSRSEMAELNVNEQNGSNPNRTWTPVKASNSTASRPQALADDDVTTLPVYTSAGFQKVDGSLYVINTAAQESDPTRIDSESLGKHFGLNASPDLQSSETRIVSVQKKIEYWPWLAATLFVLVFAEFCLSNRTTA